MKRIGIDCRLAGSQHAGIGRYVENLVVRAIKSHNFNWVLFFSDEKQALEVLKLKNLREVQKNTKLIFAPIRHYSIAEQLKMPNVFNMEKLDLLHIPHFNIPLNYKGKMIVTIHDLLWHEQRGSSVTTLPFWKYWIKYMAYKFTTKMAVHKASRILVPANTVAKTLSHYYPNAKSKTTVTKEGISNIYMNETKSGITQLSKRKKQFVYTGSLYPHKNLKLVIEALRQLPEYKLILVGSRNIFQKQTERTIKKHGVEKQVKFAGYVPDKDLIKLYKESFALTLPSLSEGFGLPGVEAMAVGLPVLASDIKIFKEIYQNAPIYFNPLSTTSFIKAVQDLEKNHSTHSELGLRISKQYSWESMTNKTLGSYEKLLNS